MTEVARAHFISYGDHNFSASVDRIEQEAREFDAFSTVSVYKNKDFYDEDFRRRFGHIIAQPRGSAFPAVAPERGPLVLYLPQIRDTVA